MVASCSVTLDALRCPQVGRNSGRKSGVDELSGDRLYLDEKLRDAVGSLRRPDAPIWHGSVRAAAPQRQHSP
jgi:hypothetical protein